MVPTFALVFPNYSHSCAPWQFNPLSPSHSTARPSFALLMVIGHPTHFVAFLTWWQPLHHLHPSENSKCNGKTCQLWRGTAIHSRLSQRVTWVSNHGKKYFVVWPSEVLIHTSHGSCICCIFKMLKPIVRCPLALQLNHCIYGTHYPTSIKFVISQVSCKHKSLPLCDVLPGLGWALPQPMTRESPPEIRFLNSW